MVSKSQIVAIVLIFLGLFTYYYTYNVYMHLLGVEQPLSAFLAQILATVNPPESLPELALVAPGFYLSEERATKFWFLVSAALVVLAILLAIVHRVRSGPSRLFVPICFCSMVLLAALLKVTNDIGLLNGT